MSMLKEYYLQPDAPEPVLPEAEVLRCVRRFVPTARAMTRVDESGGEARTYIVDEAIVLKVQTIFGLAHDRKNDPWEHA